MPKIAATLASLLLIASSIGVNIARYPQVGRAVDAAQRSDATEMENSARKSQPSGLVEGARPDCLPANEPQVDPPRPPQAGAAGPAEIAGVQQPNDSKPAVGSQPQPAATILDVRPMVPVASLQAVAGQAEPLVDHAEVRRLPPVEPGGAVVADLQAGGGDEAAPYPATVTP